MVHYGFRPEFGGLVVDAILGHVKRDTSAGNESPSRPSVRTRRLDPAARDTNTEP